MENNPLILYRQWFMDQYIVWADMIASAAMDSFDALYERSVALLDLAPEDTHNFVAPDDQKDTVTEIYQRGKHSLRLLNYIEHTVAKRNVGITSLISSLLFEITETHLPKGFSEADYQQELDLARSGYHQALADGDAEGICIGEDYLNVIEEDYEARQFMRETWGVFSHSTFNPDTISAFETF